MRHSCEPRSSYLVRRAVTALGPVITIVVAVAVLLGGGFMMANGCQVDDATATTAIENHGFTRVELQGASMLKCAEDESSRAFTATNATGRRVAGTVCCSYGGCTKGCTVRW